MEVHPNISAAIATLIAALLVFVYSFVNMIVSKDQKTTEFRQDWINSLRDEISQLIAVFHHLTIQAVRIKEIHLGCKENDGKEEYLKECNGKIHEMKRILHKIQLRINPNGKIESEILGNILEIESLSQYEKTNIADANDKSNDLIKLSQCLLKKEWVRVKRGEMSFFISKWLFLLIIVLTLIAALFLYVRM